MEKLIEALNIFLKYGNPEYPTHCEHDALYVYIEPELISNEDIFKLENLGFYPNEYNFVSYKYGSR